MNLSTIINIISVGLGTIVFILVPILNWHFNRPTALDALLLQVLAAIAIPTGIALIICGLKPNLISELKGLNVYIALAGMTLIYLSIKAVFI